MPREGLKKERLVADYCLFLSIMERLTPKNEGNFQAPVSLGFTLKISQKFRKI